MVQVKTKKMAVIGDPLLSLGLKLAGVKESYTVSSAEDAERTLSMLVDRGDIGIIVTSQSVAGSIKSKKLRDKIDTSIEPLIIAVPGYNESPAGEEMLRRLILKAVGIDLMGAGALKR
ncbi:MAG: V-type ATP synthase subunit F [Candidatus Micrarchaeia archaeon]